MSRYDPRVTLRQIVEHTGRIQELCSAYKLTDLLKDWKLTAAFEREMQILGEAVKRLPAELVVRYPQIPWKQIAGLGIASVMGTTRPIIIFFGMPPRMTCRSSP